MATPAFARLRIIGTLYGDSAWSIGVNFGAFGTAVADGSGQDPFDQSGLQAGGARDVQTILEDWLVLVRQNASGKVLQGTLQSLLSTQGAITTLRASRVGTDGKETDVAETTLGAPVVGVSGPTMPVQTCLVASLLTGRPGASYRGRVYWPALNMQLSGGAALNPAPADVASDTGQWLHDMATDLGTSAQRQALRPCIVSAKRGVLSEVTTVRVGDRLDSQSRRRGAEQETYSSSAVPA